MYVILGQIVLNIAQEFDFVELQFNRFLKFEPGLVQGACESGRAQFKAKGDPLT